MLPRVVAGYFEDAGYHVVITDNLDGIDVFSKSADASILFYAAPCSYNIGGQLSVNSFYAHFVHYKQAKSAYLGYNTGGKEGYSWLSRPSDYANQYQSFYAVGIYIYR